MPEKRQISSAAIGDLAALLADLRLALTESSNYWQVVAMHYGKHNITTEAEKKSLALRDTAIARIDAFISKTPTP